MDSGEGFPTNGVERTSVACVRCGAATGAGAKFCPACGWEIGAGTPAAPAGEDADRQRSRGGAITASTERRQITVVFCDLVGSTSLASEVDPEDLTEIIGAFQRTVTRTMNEFSGFVARYMGDGALIYFGYPQAHEDDAEQAVHAALRTMDAVAETVLPGGRRIQAHIGIATGLVVVGDIAGVGSPLGLDVAGATPNLAARLEQLAPPGAILVAESTQRLVSGSFEWRDLGEVKLKGLAEPQRAFEAVGARVIGGRFEARHRDALAPMVNREREKALLAEAWNGATQGRGQIVVVSGEAGIGKSRLAAELLSGLEGARHARLRYFCSAHRQDSPLYPCIRQLEHAAGFMLRDTATAKMAKLEALLGKISEQDLGLITELLLLPTAGRFPVLQFAPQRKRERLMQALIGLLERAARSTPLLLIVEDAQWSDASTRELMTMLATRIGGHRILCIVTTRPEFDAPWMHAPQVRRIALQPLRADECVQLIARIAGAIALPRAAVNDIVVRTDGIPLFVEEMTRAVVEGGGRIDTRHEAPARANVPVSLQASLLARLDRLGGARDIAEVAAAIGREFTQELLVEVAGGPAQDVGRALDVLVDSGLVVRRPNYRPGESGFGFRHMLIRDTAYNIMVREKRKSVHAGIAKALEAKFPDRAAANPEIIAYHCSEGGLTEKAVGYWLASGHQALRRSAMAEALTHLARGLELIRGLPDSPWRRQCELDLTVAFGKAQIATQGYAVASTGETFRRARALCEALGDPPQLLSVLHGLWTHALMRAELESARSQALDLLARGEERGDPLWRLMGHRFSGVTHHPLGAFGEARRYLTRGIELYDPKEIGKYAMITVDDPRVVMLTYLSWSLMCTGRIDEARQRGAEALEGARGLAHAFTLAHALNGASFLALTIESPRVALQRLDELMPLLQEHGIAYYGAVGILFRGYCLAALGEAAEAEVLLQKGMAAYRATGSRLYLSGFLRMSAEAHGRIGRMTTALEQIHEAFQLMYATSQRWDEAEIYRVHGGLLLAGGDADSAVAALRRALGIARAQGAGLWELRAACDLARIEAERGLRREAHEMLAPVVAGFEGQSDSPDTVGARTLLATLA